MSTFVPAVGRWLAAHDGVITRARALRLGMTPAMVSNRVESGEWIVAHRGVYLDAASTRTPRQALLAAIAAGGPGTVASHWSAAWLLGLRAEPPSRPWILVPAQRRTRLGGVTVVRSRDIGRTESHHGLPCTDPMRTILDCAAVGPSAALAQLVDAALANHCVTLAILQRAARPEPSARTPGRRALRQCLQQRGMIGAPTPSVLESKMARLLHAHGLPAPAAEVVTGPRGEYRLDYAYPELLFAVEVDGYAWHSSPEQLASDARRRNTLARRGWTVLVFTWLDLSRRPGEVAAEITDAYQRARDREARASRPRQLLGAQQK